jgi:hypothetical protein
MHDDAGRRRRRRMLLLRPRGGAATAAMTPAVVVPDVEFSSIVSVDDDYLDACGPPPQFGICVEDLARRVLCEQPFAGPMFTIGGSAENHLWLKHDRILPRHLLLLRLPGGVFFFALSPEAEVRGPKGPLKAGWWAPGMILRLGAFRLRLTGSRKLPPNDDPLAISPALENELPRLELRFHGSTPSRHCPITRPLTLIGRHAVCKIRLDHDDILPVQAALVRAAGRLWLVNFGEPDQVQVNEALTQSAALDVGDKLRVGEFRVEVLAASEWPAAAPPPAAKPATDNANLEGILQQLTAQHQKILQTQQQTMQELERLARSTSSPKEMKAALEQIRATYAALGQEQSRIQNDLKRNLPDPK